jgi:hypothetical protein
MESACWSRDLHSERLRGRAARPHMIEGPLPVRSICLASRIGMQRIHRFGSMAVFAGMALTACVALLIPASAQSTPTIRPVTTCSSPNPCASTTTTGSGRAFEANRRTARGLSGRGQGVSGNSTSGNGVLGEGGAAGVEGLGNTTSSSIGVLAANLGSGLEFDAIDSHGNSLFSVDGSGFTTSSNTVFSGTSASGYGLISTGNTGVVANAVGHPSFGLSAGPEITTYTNQTSTPTVEDFGEGQLVGGRASVAFERTFATAIDRTAGYMVFITPEGDTHGVYVTQKTAVGFVVRENQGGRSTVAFSYRIVARPFGSSAARLPLAAKPIRLIPPPLPPPAKMPAPRPDLVRLYQTAAQP